MAKLIAAHASPPNYLMFFDFFEPPNLADKIHVEEWSPSVQQVVAIASDLGPSLLISFDAPNIKTSIDLRGLLRGGSRQFCHLTAMDFLNPRLDYC